MREKNLQILSSFWLKLIAFLTMTLDHVGLFMMPLYQKTNPGLYQMAWVFRCIGRIAMPLFCLMVAEAIRKSSNPWKYFFRLLVLNLITTAGLCIFVYAVKPKGFGPNDILGHAYIDLTLIALTLLCLRFKGWKKLFAIFPIAMMVLGYSIDVMEIAKDITIQWFPRFLRPSYSILGLLFALGFYYAYPLADRISKNYAKTMGIPFDVFQESPSYRKLVNILGASAFFAVAVIFWGISYIGITDYARPFDNYGMAIQSYCLLALPLIYLYSGKRGYDSPVFRIGTYIYYPLHLAIIFLIFSI